MGELDEGQCWETVIFAAHQKLDNLICFVDENKKQLDGYTRNLSHPIDFADKFRVFGWGAYIAKDSDGEDIFNTIHESEAIKSKPLAIVLDTIKGQGINVRVLEMFTLNLIDRGRL